MDRTLAHATASYARRDHEAVMARKIPTRGLGLFVNYPRVTVRAHSVRPSAFASPLTASTVPRA
jgi:hypothetical protein